MKLDLTCPECGEDLVAWGEYLEPVYESRRMLAPGGWVINDIEQSCDCKLTQRQIDGLTEDFAEEAKGEIEAEQDAYWDWKIEEMWEREYYGAEW